jgi:hypothetical protein
VVECLNTCRTFASMPHASLDEELRLLRNFRRLDPVDRGYLLRLARRLRRDADQERAEEAALPPGVIPLPKRRIAQ